MELAEAQRPSSSRRRWGLLLSRTYSGSKRNPTLAFGVFILVVMSVIAVISPFITGEAILTSFEDRLISPSLAGFWFGTDNFGRDVYARTLQGSRISLLVGFSVALLVTVAGLVIGLVAGYFRIVDNVVMRVMDGMMAMPTILLALAIITLLGSSVQNVIIVITIVDTPRMVRIVRGVALSLREQMFVDAAEAVGVPVWRILAFHIAPNTMAPVLVQATFVFAAAILTEAALSFLGAGTPPISPSWGNIMGEGRQYLQVAFWITFFPGLFLSVTVLAINLAGDGLRDILDPRLRHRG